MCDGTLCPCNLYEGKHRKDNVIASMSFTPGKLTMKQRYNIWKIRLWVRYMGYQGKHRK